MLSSLSKDQKKLRSRILELSYTRKSSHIGSCLSVVDIIDAVYAIKKKEEKFVLSNGHAAFALYAVLEKYGFIKKMPKTLNTHPTRNRRLGIDVSTGSLGHGLPIAVGFALANREKRVFCIISDGECCEGSIWEGLRIALEQKLSNLKIVVNANGWSAYDAIDRDILFAKMDGFGLAPVKVNGHNKEELIAGLSMEKIWGPQLVFAQTKVEQLPFLRGQDALYYVMSEEDYFFAQKYLNG